jgi:signal transduction histidine kinase
MTVALPVAPIIASAQASNTQDEVRRVVILNATDPYLPAFLALDSAQREAIRAGSQVPVELYAEPLDMHRFPRKLLDRDLIALLRKKYHDLKVDVVIAVTPIALDFAQRHRNEIWPEAVIVFNSVSADLLKERSLEPRAIGLPVRLELGQTIDLALQLRPATRKIAVVAGAGDSCCGRLAVARGLLKRYAGRVDVQYLVELTLAETVAAVRALPEDAVVLYLTMFRDGAGVPHVPRDVLTRISAVSRAPIFGVFETYLGYGIAAGSIASYGAQGRATGELIARVLNGEDPAAIGVQAPVESRCIADWRQLRHWDIDEGLLPAGCEVRFKEATAWDRYHLHFLVALVVILMQTALISALLLHRRRLRRAQITLADEYARRTQAEGLAAQLRERLARFSKKRSLGAMATGIAHEINQPLIAIQNYAQAAKRRVQGNEDDKPKLIELFGKIEGQAERAGAITQRIRSLVSTNDLRLLPVSLCPQLEAVVRMMEPEVESRGCRIECQSAGELPEVLADSLQVQLVLVNLLQNAMKSICSGDRYDKRVSVDAGLIEDREVQVSVTDRGPGVPSDQVADIFEPLYSSTSGSMGMGLVISRAIIDAHGGRLWYEPNPAGGAIFRFTLRAAGS